MKPTPSQIEAESRKIRRLRAMVTLVASLLRQTDMPLVEAVRLVQAVRAQALQLFPGREQTYDILYAPRFARLLREKYHVIED